MMPDENLEKRIAEMTAILHLKKRPPGQHVGGVSQGATSAELDALDALMQRHLRCSLPQIYRQFLGWKNGLGAQGTVLYVADQGSEADPGSWPRQGIVYHSLGWLENPKVSEWIAIGEDEFDVYAISRDGTRFAKISGGTEAVQEEFASLNALLSDAVNQMIERLKVLDD